MMISCGNKSCEEERRQSTLHELGQDEVPAAPKIILLLLKRQWLMAGATCAGGVQEKGDNRECRSIVRLRREGGRWLGMWLIKRPIKRVGLFWGKLVHGFCRNCMLDRFYFLCNRQA